MTADDLLAKIDGATEQWDTWDGRSADAARWRVAGEADIPECAPRGDASRDAGHGRDRTGEAASSPAAAAADVGGSAEPGEAPMTTDTKRRLREKAYWRIEAAEDWLLDRSWCKRIPDWVFQGQQGQRAFLLREHKAIADQCGNPQHDYCAWCGTRMPGQAR